MAEVVEERHGGCRGCGGETRRWQRLWRRDTEVAEVVEERHGGGRGCGGETRRWQRLWRRDTEVAEVVEERHGGGRGCGGGRNGQWKLRLRIQVATPNSE